MKPDSHNTSPADPASERALHEIARHQRRLKWLTAAAVTFWLLAVIGTVGTLVCYAVFVAPKERQIHNDYSAHRSLVIPESAARLEGTTPADHALGVNFTMTQVVTKGVIIIAISVVILSLGTMATLLVTIFNRRVTLSQINHSLAQISQQLRELKAGS